MSRFSKSEAEARGWVFVHEQEPETIVTNSVQGETRTREGYARAEKTYNGIALNEVAPNMGLLLEKIALTEAHWASVEESQETTEPEIAAEQVDEPIRTVTLPGGEQITEEEWAGRSRRDVLVVKDGDDTKQIFLGGTEESGEAADSVAERQAEIENRRAQEEDHGDTEQLEVTAPQIDNPGGHGGGLVVVRKGESLDDAAERLALEGADREDERVNAAQTPLGTPAPEDAPELAGVDGGIQERGDLESEQADQGATVEAAEAAESVVQVETDESDAGQEAAEEAAKEAGDEDPKAAEAARAEAEQKEADKASSSKSEVKATDAAREAAKGKIAIDKVEGHGKDGLIRVEDVEAALEARKAKK